MVDLKSMDNIYGFLVMGAEGSINRILLASALAGVSGNAIIVLINTASQDLSVLEYRYFILFVLAIAILVVSTNYSFNRVAQAVQQSTSKLVWGIAHKIRDSKTIDYEKIGDSRIYSIVAENTQIIHDASRDLVTIAAQSTMLLFSLVYMFVLSVPAFLILLAILSVTIVIYIAKFKEIAVDLRLTKQKEQEYYSTLKQLLNGFMEVKSNRSISRELIEERLEYISEELNGIKLSTEKKYIENIVFGKSVLYMVLGAFVFVLPQISSTPPEIIVQLTLLATFIIAPIGFIIESVSIVTKANVAIKSVMGLDRTLDESSDYHDVDRNDPVCRGEVFDRVEFKGIKFTYPEDDSGSNRGERFVVGPFDLEVQRGELIFIVGGNGSGKSSMMKLLSGHYYPDEGKIRVGGITIDSENYECYRELITHIYADFHLFDRLYGLVDIDRHRVNDLLEEMGLNSKTSFHKDFFTNLNLSTGQKKRLALIAAMLYDKPIMLLDEITADQDPHFREYLYHTFFPALISQGKTLIVISHDDRYFHLADRVVKMDFGKIVSIDAHRRPVQGETEDGVEH